MIFLWVPETKQRTLEELDYVFAVKTSQFTRYQTTKALPWWFRRYVLFQRGATLEPLYNFDMPDAGAGGDGNLGRGGGGGGDDDKKNNNYDDSSDKARAEKKEVKSPSAAATSAELPG